MSESVVAFVARRRPAWEALEALLRRARAGGIRLDDLRELDRLYRSAAADLARAQAELPGTEAHRYLNQLCGAAYAFIYRPRRDLPGALKAFFARELPRLVRQEMKFVLASAWIFALATALGALIVLVEPRGAELLVPAGVQEHVEDGRLWTDDLLSSAPPGAVASEIATNNLTVILGAFAGGFLLGLGTLAMLVLNGLSLGAVFAFTAQRGLGSGLGYFIGAHGPVELSILVLSGAAGLIVGHALIDPGDAPRGVRLKERARVAARILLGCAPFLAAIAIVEGYVSPGDFFGGPVRVGVGLALGGLLWAYLLVAGRATGPGVPL